MISFRTLAQITEDRQVVLQLPSEVPVGEAELVVNITPQPVRTTRKPRSSLADWADEHAEHWGNRLNSASVEEFTGRR